MISRAPSEMEWLAPIGPGINVPNVPCAGSIKPGPGNPDMLSIAALGWDGLRARGRAYIMWDIPSHPF